MSGTKWLWLVLFLLSSSDLDLRLSGANGGTGSVYLQLWHMAGSI